jgi:hypothetical protein
MMHIHFDDFQRSARLALPGFAAGACRIGAGKLAIGQAVRAAFAARASW